MKGKEVFSKGTVLVKNMDGTFSWLDVNEMEWENLGKFQKELGEMVVSGHEADCFRLAAKWNEISRKCHGATFLLKSEVLDFFVSNLSPHVFGALMDGDETCDPWKILDGHCVDMLEDPNAFKGLEDFAY